MSDSVEDYIAFVARNTNKKYAQMIQGKAKAYLINIGMNSFSLPRPSPVSFPSKRALLR